MKDMPFQRALVLGAHTDDEFGCGGTILRLIDSKCEVHIAAFSSCEESVPEGFDRSVLTGEFRRAAEALAIEPERVRLFDYPVRHFPSRRQEILEDLVQLRREIDPDLVLLPASSDIHQDHQVISQEGTRAFKFATILGYELPMNTITFEHACFVELTDEMITRKIRSMACYESQAFRPYMTEDFIRGLASVRGIQAGVPCAEAFEVIRFKI